MSGLQRDHTTNGIWTNHEGYNDSTAGAAIKNVMREQSNQAARQAPTKKPKQKLEGTRLIQVTPKDGAHVQKPKHPSPSVADVNNPAMLKMARTLFTICTMICRMQNFTIDAITIRDKGSGAIWNKTDLEAPQPK